MKLKLAQNYDRLNKAGEAYEILAITRGTLYASEFGVLVKLNNHKMPVWLTIDWFLPPWEVRPTKDAPDKGKAPAKKASSKPGHKSTKKALA